MASTLLSLTRNYTVGTKCSCGYVPVRMIDVVTAPGGANASHLMNETGLLGCRFGGFCFGKRNVRSCNGFEGCANLSRFSCIQT